VVLAVRLLAVPFAVLHSFGGALNLFVGLAV